MLQKAEIHMSPVDDPMQSSGLRRGWILSQSTRWKANGWELGSFVGHKAARQGSRWVGTRSRPTVTTDHEGCGVSSNNMWMPSVMPCFRHRPPDEEGNYSRLARYHNRTQRRFSWRVVIIIINIIIIVPVAVISLLSFTFVAPCGWRRGELD